jgi:hypothetical protein
MASLMGVTLIAGDQHDLIERKLHAVYSFGQPLVADAEFAPECENLKKKLDPPNGVPVSDLDGTSSRDRPWMIRFVFRNDAAPHLPFAMEGVFKHFGVEYRYHDEWEFSKKVTPQVVIAGFSDALVSLTGGFAILRPLRDQIRKLPYLLSFGDHEPQNYIDALWVKPLK